MVNYFQQWIPTWKDSNQTNLNEPYYGDQEVKRYTGDNRYAISNQRGNSTNCTPKCFAEKGSRVS